jgi:N6-L-threonylcarbamoyladenine synthase
VFLCAPPASQDMSLTILAIESSCDDTAAAVFRDGQVLSNCVANQDAHRIYGGVVPEVASRAHQINIIPVVDLALRQAGVDKTAIDAVAFTRGPGLMGSLLVGVSFAKAFALSRAIPLLEANHLQAHVLSHFAEEPKPCFPFLCLTVSGGHTQIVLVRDYLEMEIIGQTLDDAAGEAFDKTGKMLGLDYPAGPLIDRLAQQGKPVFGFPEPQIPALDFSFSGLKTAILYFLRREKERQPDFIETHLADICASVQHRIVTILMNKLRQAAEQTGIREIAIAGGVSANSELRAQLAQAGRELGWNTYIPKFEYCTDNAAMIAVVGYYKYLRGEFATQDVEPAARL